MPEQPDSFVVESLVSPGRFGRYLLAAGDDRNKAVELYRWSTALSAACFEAFHYVEIVVRNAMDAQLREHFGEDRRGIPWFLLPVTTNREFADNIERVRRGLRDHQSGNREERDQILATLNFGVWVTLLGKEGEELWRKSLHKAFPRSSGRRKDVLETLDSLRIFRNRLAHHDSLIGVDVPFRLQQMRAVLHWVDPLARDLLDTVERVTAVNAERPLRPMDTVVVGARDAWPLYLSTGTYLCQPKRSFQPVAFIAFYTDWEIKPEIARIRSRRESVDWSDTEVNRLRATGDADDARIADIIVGSRAEGWTQGRYQVFDLTTPGDTGHRSLDRAVPHPRTERGSAYARNQRYTSRDALVRARSTDDLP